MIEIVSNTNIFLEYWDHAISHEAKIKVLVDTASMEPNIGLTPSCLSKGQEEAITRRELVYEMRVDREQAKLKMKLILFFFEIWRKMSFLWLERRD